MTGPKSPIEAAGMREWKPNHSSASPGKTEALKPAAANRTIICNFFVKDPYRIVLSSFKLFFFTWHGR